LAWPATGNADFSNNLLGQGFSFDLRPLAIFAGLND
jgi:hypothetical protein